MPYSTQLLAKHSRPVPQSQSELNHPNTIPGENEYLSTPSLISRKIKNSPFLPHTTLNPSTVLYLQRTIGNKAVQRLLVQNKHNANSQPSAPVQRSTVSIATIRPKPLQRTRTAPRATIQRVFNGENIEKLIKFRSILPSIFDLQFVKAKQQAAEMNIQYIQAPKLTVTTRKEKIGDLRSLNNKAKSLYKKRTQNIPNLNNQLQKIARATNNSTNLILGESDETVRIVNNIVYYLVETIPQNTLDTQLIEGSVESVKQVLLALKDKEFYRAQQALAAIEIPTGQNTNGLNIQLDFKNQAQNLYDNRQNDTPANVADQVTILAEDIRNRTPWNTSKTKPALQLLGETAALLIQSIDPTIMNSQQQTATQQDELAKKYIKMHPHFTNYINPRPSKKAQEIKLDNLTDDLLGLTTRGQNGELTNQAVPYLNNVGQEALNKYNQEKLGIANSNGNGIDLPEVPDWEKINQQMHGDNSLNPVTGRTKFPESQNIQQLRGDAPEPTGQDAEVTEQFTIGGVDMNVTHNKSDVHFTERIDLLRTAGQKVQNAGINLPPLDIDLPKLGRATKLNSGNPNPYNGRVSRAEFIPTRHLHISSETVGNPLAEIIFDPKTGIAYHKYSSTDLDPTGVASILHELGHAMHYTHSPEKFHDLTSTTLKISVAELIAREVSAYAAMNPREVCAEVFMGTIMGRKFSDDVMQIYNNFGGYPVGIVRNNIQGEGVKLKQHKKATLKRETKLLKPETYAPFGNPIAAKTQVFYEVGGQIIHNGDRLEKVLVTGQLGSHDRQLSHLAMRNWLSTNINAIGYIKASLLSKS